MADPTPQETGRRGALPGENVQRPHEPTDELRIRAKTLAGFMPVHLVATHMDISPPTLRRYYAKELSAGRAAIIASVGSSMIQRAMGQDEKADLRLKHDAQKFVLSRLGGWNQQNEEVEAEHKLNEGRRYDLSHLSTDEKRALLPVLTRLLSGPALNDGPQVEDGEFTSVEGEADGERRD